MADQVNYIPKRACPICGATRAPGRRLCKPCDEGYEHSREHARAATALTDYVDRMRAERQNVEPAPKRGGYRPPDPDEDGGMKK
jgi:hypothetical protein